MFLLLFMCGIWCIFGGLALFAKIFGWKDYNPSDYLTPGIVFTGITAFVLACSTTSNWHDNVSDIAQYRQIDNQIIMRNDVMNKNLPEIKEVLVEMYPQHERDIFESIEKRNAQWLWEKYPEMRASSTMQRYVSELNAYTMWVQEAREKQLALLAQVETRKNTPWAVSFLIPTVNEKVSLESE